jgi:hypothetical protein
MTWICYCPACVCARVRRWFRSRSVKLYGTTVKSGICRDTKIGDLLPPESTGLIQCATIELNNQRAVIVHVTFIPTGDAK